MKGLGKRVLLACSSLVVPGCILAACTAVLLTAAPSAHPDGKPLGVWYGISIAAFVILCQVGRALVRFACPPLFPRQNYFGAADIAPEPETQYAIERRSLVLLTLLVLAVGIGGVAWARWHQMPFLPMLGFTGGVLLEAPTAWRNLSSDRAEEIERHFRQRYVLYLRSFRSSRWWAALAAAGAAQQDPVVMMISPRRSEARSFGWYAYSLLFPFSFSRFHFWTTSDEDWHRVVNSCMAYSRAMILDCSGMRSLADTGPTGLTSEVIMSLAHGCEHPVAYLVTEARWTNLPGPALVMVSTDPLWLLMSFAPLVRRLRSIILRTIDQKELAYLQSFHASRSEAWSEAMTRERNHAHREGREDPLGKLLARRPMQDLPGNHSDVS